MLETAIAVRLSPEHLAKLARLQKRTRRSRSEVLRLLIDSAMMPARTDIRVDPRRMEQYEDLA
jgi:predicted DNA-binding protein